MLFWKEDRLWKGEKKGGWGGAGGMKGDRGKVRGGEGMRDGGGVGLSKRRVEG